MPGSRPETHALKITRQDTQLRHVLLIGVMGEVDGSAKAVVGHAWLVRPISAMPMRAGARGFEARHARVRHD